MAAVARPQAQVQVQPQAFSNAPSRMSSPKYVNKNLPRPEASSSLSSSPMAEFSPLNPRQLVDSTVDDNKNNRKDAQNKSSRHASPPQQPVQPPPETAPDRNSETESKPVINAQPLGPPPKPSEGGDYFNQSHSSTHFNLEPNPFEAQFGTGSSNETPGKALLPPIANLTSPSSLLPGGTPGWAESLRSGPLSPAMLPGPTGSSDYFAQTFRGSFPTPNESSLRTGLTPGGGGSMFPAASPGTQHMLNGLQSGGATPGTLDFHRTAVNAAAASKAGNKSFNASSNGNGATSQPESNNQFASSNVGSQSYHQKRQQQSQPDPFGQHDANDAANGLYMLAQQSTGPRNTNQYAQNHPPNIQTNLNGMSTQSPETSPLSRRGNHKDSIASIPASAGTGEGSDSGISERKPTTRSRGGKKASANGKAVNNRRRADEAPAKAPAAKKAKANTGLAMPEDDSDDDMDDSMMMEESPNGRKMTDEEKRKNFLERNRVAALKCRQRKKQWLQNLQNKVEIYSAENDALSGQVQQLREELVGLKTLLLAHKDCPVSGQQGLSGMNMHAYLEQITGGHPGANPYGLGINAGQVPPGMAAQMGMQMGQQGQAGLQRS